MKKEIKMLLMAVVKIVANDVKNQMDRCATTEQYIDAQTKADDLVKYYGVLSSLDGAISFADMTTPEEEEKWEQEFFDKDGDWSYIGGWIADEWLMEDIVEEAAKEEKLEDFKDEVMALFYRACGL